MKIRMTLTAIALGTMTLAGCSSYRDTVVGSTPAAAPAATVAAPSATMTAPAMSAPAATMTAPSATMTAPAMSAPAATMAAPAVQSESMMGMEADTMTDATMMDDTMAQEASMSANDAAMNACFAAGGQVVGWVGDPTGAEQACRREDGLEYRLADAQYYQ